MSGVFDAATFMETQFKGGLDTKFVNPDAGDYTAQITDRITINQGEKDGRTWAQLMILWEIMDEAQKTKLNTERVFVRQQFFLDLDDNGQLDLGTNKNMKLKRVLDSTGLNSSKSWTLASLKFQTAFVTVAMSDARDG